MSPHGPADVEPIAQMFLADTALADTSPMAPPVTRAQVCPSKCQVPVPGPAPEQPNAQTSLSLTAVIPVASRPEDPGSASATCHWLPFQCRMSPFASVTAHTLLADTTLAALTLLCRPEGSALPLQLVPSQCSATGVPGAGKPARLVLPNAHASPGPGTATAVYPE